MRDKVMRKNDRIRWFISSANRDPDAFPSPDTFDISRHPNQHVAFGSGTHHCLGATLARVEGQEVFKALAERFPNLQGGDRGAGVSAQHHVPVAEIAARHLALGEPHWRES